MDFEFNEFEYFRAISGENFASLREAKSVFEKDLAIERKEFSFDGNGE